MQRLTHERSNGIKTGYWSPEKKEDLVARLAEYENTGLAPDEIESLKKYQWIPVEKRLPEPFLNVLATVYHSEWISDYDSSWVSDEEKIYHPESRGTYLAFVDCDSQWTYLDESNQENTCDEKFCDDKSVAYSVVIAWMPLPEPYKGTDND